MVEFDLQHVVVATGRNVSCSGLYFVESVFLAKNVLRHAVRMTFLDGKNYGTNSTVFPMSFLSFFLKTKSSVSPTNFTDVLLIGSNVM